MFNKNPQDLDRASASSRRYVFNTEDDTWKNFGSLKDIPLVSEETNGLIYPDLYNIIKELENKLKNGELNNLKLTKNKPYFYFFYNSDNFVKIVPEYNNLRIEANKGALSRRITRTPCISRKGPRGKKGISGRNGMPATNEKLRPTYPDGSFDLSVNTPLPDEPISLRGYDQFKLSFEALISPDGSVFDPNNGLSNIELIGNFDSGKVTIKGILNDPNLRFKIRQRGPKGEDGTNGVNYVQVIIDEAPTNGEFTEVLGMFRYNGAINAFIYKKTSVNALLNNVINLQTKVNIPTGDYWPAVEVSSNLTKAIEYHKFDPDIKKPFLNLPSYTPLSGCYSQIRYSIGYIRPEQTPDGMVWTESSPFTIIGDKLPEYTSCKEPYWFCENSGECDAEINVNPRNTIPPFDDSSSSESSFSSPSSDTTSSSSQSESTESSTESSSDTSSGSTSESTPSSQTIESYSTNSSESSATSSTSSDADSSSKSSEESYSTNSSESDITSSTSSFADSSSSSSESSNSSDSSESDITSSTTSTTSSSISSNSSPNLSSSSSSSTNTSQTTNSSSSSQLIEPSSSSSSSSESAEEAPANTFTQIAVPLGAGTGLHKIPLSGYIPLSWPDGVTSATVSIRKLTPLVTRDIYTEPNYASFASVHGPSRFANTSPVRYHTNTAPHLFSINKTDYPDAFYIGFTDAYADLGLENGDNNCSVSAEVSITMDGVTNTTQIDFTEIYTYNLIPLVIESSYPQLRFGSNGELIKVYFDFDIDMSSNLGIRLELLPGSVTKTDLIFPSDPRYELTTTNTSGSNILNINGFVDFSRIISQNITLNTGVRVVLKEEHLFNIPRTNYALNSLVRIRAVRSDPPP